MALIFTDDQNYSDIADAIRAKNGSSDTYLPSEMADAIAAISGGGGASNVVTGTFTGTTTGAAMDVTLNYSGSGYPIAIMIYPKEGSYNSSGTFYSLVQRYATAMFYAVKSCPELVPGFSGRETPKNDTYVSHVYKNSSSNATGRGLIGGVEMDTFDGSAAVKGQLTIVRFKSTTKMSVFIASTSYGFAANIEYAYTITYSS